MKTKIFCFLTLIILYVCIIFFFAKDYRQINIFCIGDSLTAGAGGDGVTYCKELQKMLSYKYKVNRFGVGGENSDIIARRVGGKELFVSNFIIPDNTKDMVEITLEPDIGLAYQGTAGLNPVTINGVLGEITSDYVPGGNNDNVKHYFRRLQNGENVIIPAHTPVYTYASNLKCDCLVIWSGTNDHIDMSNVDMVKDNIDSIINHFN